MTGPVLSLPGKPLKLKQIGDKSPGMLLLTALFSIAVGLMLLATTYGTAKSIHADYRIGAAPHHVLEDANIDGECKTRLFILSSCKATIRNNGQTWKKDFMFFDFSFDDLSVNAIAPDADPSQVTLDIAATKTFNRSLFAALIAAIAAVLFFSGLKHLQSSRRHFAILSALNRSDAQPWRLTEAEVGMADGDSMTFTTHVNGSPVALHVATQKNSAWTVRRLSDTQARVLAVTPQAGGVTVPIDNQLAWLGGLGSDEKSQLLQTINQYLQHSAASDKA